MPPTDPKNKEQKPKDTFDPAAWSNDLDDALLDALDDDLDDDHLYEPDDGNDDTAS